MQNRYLLFSTDAIFQGLKRLFALSLKKDGRESYYQYYLPAVQIKDYSVIINGRNFFGQPITNYLKAYDNLKRL